MASLLTYNQKGNLNNQNDFFMQYSDLVKRIAYHLIARLPQTVQIDDLIQAGMIGLIEAKQNYDASKGASFETYAGIRIRGAMLDEMRKGDWIPRSVHKNNREIGAAINQLETQLNREPTHTEIADHMQIALEQYHAMIADINSSKLIGLENLVNNNDDGHDIVLQIKDTNAQNPFNEVADESFKLSLIEFIKELPEREALILSLYYDEELNLKEIGSTLNISESRVSQILSQIINKLRVKLSSWD